MANILYKVQVGAFSKRENAEAKKKSLIDKNFSAIIVESDGYYKVQCGAFTVKENAERVKADLFEKGVGSIIVESDVTTNEVSGAMKVYNQMKPYIDSKTAHKDFIKEYNKMIDKIGGGHSHVNSSNAWCTEFVNLMFWLTGQLDLIGYGKTAKVLYNTAKKKGTWKSGSDDIKFGDVVIYKDKDGDPNHTEFAIGSHDFVSGNYKGGVHKRHRSSLSTVKGRIRPEYK